MEDHLMCKRKRLKCCHKKPVLRRRSAQIQLSDLPVDVLGTILSKLTPKEIVRTSVLSNEWKHMWTVCPKLRFGGPTMCGQDVAGTQQYTQKFIDNVNGVLKQYHDKLVEKFGVEFEFDPTLAEHLDRWVDFALSSRVKNLALDLLPARWGLLPYRYRFPIELFDGESISRLQHLQLSFVSFDESSSQFCGFPNLKKLDLDVVRITRKGLEDMLSNCSNLEWLSIARCDLEDELRVHRPLPRLLYLQIAYCRISKIELIAMNLQTFAHRPLDCLVSLEAPWPQGNGYKFSRLRYLQLKLSMSVEGATNLLSLASFLNTAPLIEKLEMHVYYAGMPPHDGSEIIRRLPGSAYSYLKNLTISGFAGCTGQVELLIHIVENARNLEALTIDRVSYYGVKYMEEFVRKTRPLALLDIARRHLNGRLSENTKVSLM